MSQRVRRHLDQRSTLLSRTMTSPLPVTRPQQYVLLSVAALALMMTACGGSEPPAPVSAAAAPAPTVPPPAAVVNPTPSAASPTTSAPAPQVASAAPTAAAVRPPAPTDLPPLPLGVPPARPIESVRQAYTFAAM